MLNSNVYLQANMDSTFTTLAIYEAKDVKEHATISIKENRNRTEDHHLMLANVIPAILEISTAMASVLPIS
jgi:hypothetical protein